MLIFKNKTKIKSEGYNHLAKYQFIIDYKLYVYLYMNNLYRIKKYIYTFGFL